MFWPEFYAIAAWNVGTDQALLAGVIEGVIFVLTKSRLSLMILSKLKIVAFAGG
jgi:hypothetical protein